MHPKNSTNLFASQELVTALVGFCNTPIDNRGIQLLQVASGTNAEDALQTAKVLSSGLGQICSHMHDSLNMGEMVYCDGMAALGFLAETVSALVWSVQKGAASEGELAQ
ncbi:hypothetical protein KVQ82_09245 [Pseudomonas sp. AO-1]|uniref:hypothetical protein n=1 Tax=Pseudomonas sp. AO-1 TaxID=2855434 RepID=UPI001C75C4E7|nr:hypothetical protein [Pseudomonas sp. AO-1]QXZ16074.1 hypothetical protein KVQ82_09245 [Pseudomonas sp. AO-1]